MTTGTDTATLAKASVFAEMALTAAQAARSFSRPNLDAEDQAKVPGYLDAAVSASRSCVATLEALGADFPATPQSEPIPLHLLDTPDTRELLERLQAALPVAERIDAARGRSLNEAFPGDAKGLDLGDALAALIARMTTEVHGAKGRE